MLQMFVLLLCVDIPTHDKVDNRDLASIDVLLFLLPNTTNNDNTFSRRILSNMPSGLS